MICYDFFIDFIYLFFLLENTVRKRLFIFVCLNFRLKRCLQLLLNIFENDRVKMFDCLWLKYLKEKIVVRLDLSLFYVSRSVFYKLLL